MATFKDLLTYFKDTAVSSNSKDHNTVLFREQEKEFLLKFLGPKNSVTYPSLFIYGHTASGKTFLVENIVKDLKLSHVWVNCRETNNSKLIYKHIIEQLDDDNAYMGKNFSSCEFVNVIKLLLRDKRETNYIIVDNAEVLQRDYSLLSIFIKLQEKTQCNVCTILISELPWFNFRNCMSSFSPISLHFPNYTKDEIYEILCNKCPENHSRHFYDGYINVILKTFYPVTRNLRELKHVAEINFEKYCEPLTEEPDFEISNLRLWKNIEPTLKEAMNSVYLREISGTKWKNQCKPDSDSNEKKSSASVAKYSLTRELPFYSKFLLLSAYFASYNQHKTDFRHFVKNQGKQKKKRITKKVEKNRHLLGPKPFTLDRMLSIFFSIVGERVLPSAMIFAQISSLVSMHLVSRISLDDQLDCPKYKCMAELDLVEKIGKTVNIDVLGYLDDFL